MTEQDKLQAQEASWDAENEDGESRQVDVLLAALVTEWENFANRCDKEAQKGFNCCEIIELSARAGELRDCAKELKKILTQISS